MINMAKNASTTEFYKGVPLIEGDESHDLLLPIIGDIAGINMEFVYVLDFLKKCFRFVTDRNTFLCGYSVEEVLSLGYDFYPKVIHREDLLLFKNIHAAILRRLSEMNNSSDINYFSFALRIKNGSQFIMVNHKLKPVFIEGKIRFGICLLTSSTLKKAGQLCAHYNNGTDFDEYLFNVKKWRKGIEQTLTMREKNILKLAKQGKTFNEIADELCLSYNTIRNVKASIYKKLNVNNMIQAVTYASNYHLIYGCNNEQKSVKQLNVKRIRRLMTSDKILRIQEKLNIGQSVNSIAKQEKISESAIRYAINRGKLIKKIR